MSENGLDSAEAAKAQANQHFKGTAVSRAIRSRLRLTEAEKRFSSLLELLHRRYICII